MTVVAVHQPNYLPWLGYFYKIACADVFIFLDDVQFSKNGYINRVRILNAQRPHWLTIPVSVTLGDPINRVRPARAGWAESHLATLSNSYRRARAFASVWPDIERLYAALPAGDLAAINRYLVESLARRLGFGTRFATSSAFSCGSATGDDRLIALVEAVDADGTYLSGGGGANYQAPSKFAAAGLALRYTDFVHPRYDQDDGGFVEGLSIIDALFRLGWEETARLLGPHG